MLTEESKLARRKGAPGCEREPDKKLAQLIVERIQEDIHAQGDSCIALELLGIALPEKLLIISSSVSPSRRSVEKFEQTLSPCFHFFTWRLRPQPLQPYQSMGQDQGPFNYVSTYRNSTKN